MRTITIILLCWTSSNAVYTQIHEEAFNVVGYTVVKKKSHNLRYDFIAQNKQLSLFDRTSILYKYKRATRFGDTTGYKTPSSLDYVIRTKERKRLFKSRYKFVVTSYVYTRDLDSINGFLKTFNYTQTNEYLHGSKIIDKTTVNYHLFKGGYKNWYCIIEGKYYYLIEFKKSRNVCVEGIEYEIRSVLR